MKILIKYASPFIFLALFIIPNSLFVMTEWEKAVKFQFGEIKAVYSDAGLHFKLPLFQNVTKFDARIQTLDTQPEQFLTREKKNLIVDTFVKWQIEDAGLFYKSVQGMVAKANSRLDQIIKSGLRSEFAKKDLQDVVGGSNDQGTTRAQIQATILKLAYDEGLKLGVKVVDVRLIKVELPSDVLESVYNRMRTDREQIAKELRSKGESAYIEIRANADKERTIMLADAYKSAEMIKGEGDAIAATNYASAYQKNSDFYNFFRSMQAYRNAFANPNDILILNPDSDFLQYLKKSAGSAQ